MTKWKSRNLFINCRQPVFQIWFYWFLNWLIKIFVTCNIQTSVYFIFLLWDIFDATMIPEFTVLKGIHSCFVCLHSNFLFAVKLWTRSSEWCPLKSNTHVAAFSSVFGTDLYFWVDGPKTVLWCVTGLLAHYFKNLVLCSNIFNCWTLT